MTRKPLSLLFLAATLAAPLHAFAAGATMQVAEPYVRAVPAGQNATAAYMILRNTGKQDVALVTVESPVARAVELHTVISQGGMMKMRPVPKMEVKAGGETRLQPGGFHIMLIGMKEPLKEGASVSLTLGFDDGSKLSITAPVRATAGAHGHAAKQSHALNAPFVPGGTGSVACFIPAAA